MKKRWMFAALVAILALAMVGCSDGGSTTPTIVTVDLTFEDGFTTPAALIKDASGNDVVVKAEKDKALGATAFAAFPAQTRSGYQFVKRIEKGDAAALAIDADSVFTVDTTLVAQWAVNTWKVTIDLNGGEKTPAPTLVYTFDRDGSAAERTFAYSTLTTIGTGLTQYQNTFEGWYEGATKITDLTGSLEVTKDVIIRANWTYNGPAVATFSEVLALENGSHAIFKFSLPPGKRFDD
jgi:hypothetical protein